MSVKFRVGIGYDIHRLKEGRRLFLGGIEVPCEKGLVGHSDADVLIHAICDALLGAAGCGDIGEHFPDTDPHFKNIASSRLLRNVVNILRLRKYVIRNVDAVVILEKPKLGPYKKMMAKKISELLGIEADCVSVKAKTNEGLSETGKRQAIASFATAMIEKVRR